ALGGGDARTNAEVHAASAPYRDFVALAREDIAASVAEENRYRPDWGAVGPTMRAKRRNLDPRWLVATNARYELVGVLNRMDRAPFTPGSCGELRLVYRLAYSAPKVASRLPFAINVAYLLEPRAGSCREHAAAWRLPPAPTVDWLRTDGPLRADNLRRVKVIQANYQVIRSAAGIRNQHGGTSEYVLRAFVVADGRLVRAPLENTPDIERLRADPALRAELIAFLGAHLDELDRGTIQLPAKFLATAASSFSPHGLARMQNRPFDAVLDPADLAALDLSTLRLVKTPRAALLRLDDLTCVGCHQGRGVAGFHFVGEDRADTHPLNAVHFAGSGHFRADLARRLAYVDAIERGAEPSHDRPISIAPIGARATYGDLCALPDARSFDWTCEDGLRCQSIEPAVGETELGHCFPAERRAGDPCLAHHVIQDHHSLDKMVMPWTELGCARGYACRMPVAGFPNGMCTSPCDQIATPGEICGPTAGTGFADCLAGKATFRECLERHAELQSRGRCNATRACRSDYVCARAGDEPDGACVPAYFLFQLRVDGHPAPET
ncbi:MAG: hypothetical protein K8M05_34045, partial [Deltaproteobacteria bacterium]|nr:hypothetical protein [Kofleriaceae bacterium]